MVKYTDGNKTKTERSKIGITWSKTSFQIFQGGRLKETRVSHFHCNMLRSGASLLLPTKHGFCFSFSFLKIEIHKYNSVNFQFVFLKMKEFIESKQSRCSCGRQIAQEQKDQNLTKSQRHKEGSKKQSKQAKVLDKDKSQGPHS